MTRSAEVDAHMGMLEHPMAAQVERLRSAILDADSRINESIKWNARSFFIDDHFATFNLHYPDRIQIVMHAGAKVNPAAKQFESGSCRAAEVGSGRSGEHHLQKQRRSRQPACSFPRHPRPVDRGGLEMGEQISEHGPDRVVIENVNHPGHTSTVDARMYHSMREALLKVLPVEAPGWTQGQMREAVVPHLPIDLFPGGAKAGWWAKSVQLDLEAKGIIARESSKPLRWHLVSD